MNIDLRNINSDFESAILKIKKAYNFKTNTQALEHACTRYLEIVLKFEKESHEHTQRTLQYYDLLDQVENYFEVKEKLKSRVKQK
ncbi:hypothetical protein N7U66_01960 [Lacinutrix neustonica]|uniref:Uncharacterized protein n=1 Tax=Lacinutrix neustonica TaxID=2980107 RepID=A0A9E8MW86_9FLAO|nr:hypothetical protein [Lacinutrix neustonica]WAC02501.1 hypothetical protein N7U66_01960 [Lacinutrix neustonica]